MKQADVGILLVDDHPVVRQGYRRLLENEPGYRVVAEAVDAATAYQAYRASRPSVVIMDLALPGSSGLEATRHIRQWDKDAKILVFTMHQGAQYAVKAFEAGAIGYITKTSEPEALIKAVGIVASGGQAISDDIARDVATERLSGKRSNIDGLGPREFEVLRLVALGKTKEEISTSLNLSSKTIQNYHYRVKNKLGARNDAHLVWLSIRSGLLDL